MLEFLPLTNIVSNHHNTCLKRRLRTCNFLLLEWINHYYTGIADLKKKKKNHTEFQIRHLKNWFFSLSAQV